MNIVFKILEKIVGVETALKYAVKYENTHAINELLNKVNIKDKNISGLLIGIAIKNGCINSLSILLNAGANPDYMIIDKYEKVPIEYILQDFSEIKNSFLTASEKYKKQNSEYYFEYKALKLLLENKADLNIKDYSLDYPLNFAVENLNYDVVKILIDAGASVNIYSTDYILEDGNTPLHILLDNLKLYYEDLDDEDTYSKNKIQKGKKIASLLIEKGLSPDTKNKEGISAREFAKKIGIPDFFNKLNK